ncbi:MULTISPECIES: PTS ascorbate transporter subunit IIC [Oceanotoga]|jgi:PTS system ascorbate-specific IIC component|uniref:Ascorbate-specific PTS system EIIC component n=1 Tax=Oceanotoga teriensis TaxID=515440 RepID=A0AA45C5C1_9BACT|nr:MULTISPECIES: PTS ascorbate transporter subunit IIC [Oceanotoga]MDN5342988.1 ascorbate system component [Oceanotoga sp.]MDO7976175.1 PTS ascorbate transporter subunit IIC [Oceanotoga teriensis]PWJ88528.1 PTS system IIC component (L-Asc family) [Oceanotoga teriensis]
MAVINFIINQIFREPAIFLGIISFVGLLIQKKSFSDLVKGTMKTIIGVVILTQGTTILVNSISPLSEAFNVLYKIDGAATMNPMGTDKFLSTYGSQIGLAMVLAFAINLIVARFTKLKNVFLTGHMLFWFPFVFTAVGVESGLKGAGLTAFSTILTAIYIIVTPALIKPFVKNVTGDDSFTLGHPTVGLSLISGYLGKLFGDKSKSTEDIKFPKQLDFLKEITITSSIVMFFVYIVVGLMIGADRASVFGAEKSLVIFAIMQGVLFGAGLTVLLMGVRMMLSEIIPAFKGISDKVIPNAVPALDCPIIFPYAPNAVIIGFVVSMITSIITLVIVGKAGLFNYAVLPLTITCFFEIGTAAVIGNGTGGKRGAIIGSAVAGIIMIFLVGFSVPILKNTISEWILIFGGNDFSIWALISSGIGKIFGM